MTRTSRTAAMLATIALVAATEAVTSQLAAEEATTVAALAQQTHFHGIAEDPTEPSRLYLATHHR
jgi:hypothetical protein